MNRREMVASLLAGTSMAKAFGRGLRSHQQISDLSHDCTVWAVVMPRDAMAINTAETVLQCREMLRVAGWNMSDSMIGFQRINKWLVCKSMSLPEARELEIKVLRNDKTANLPLPCTELWVEVHQA